MGLLSGYTFLKRFNGSSSGLIFSDRLSMITALQQECILEGSGGWTFPVTCLNAFLKNFVFPIPFVYFLTILLLKAAILYFLFLIFKNLILERGVSEKVRRVVPLTAVVVLIVGGAGRFFIGGSDLIIVASIYSGMWAQLIILISLLLFLQGKLPLSGVFLGIGIFLHPANTIHVAAVLFIAGSLGLFNHRNELTISRILCFGAPVLLAVVSQYLAAFGFPEINSLLNFGQAGLESQSTEALGVGNGQEYSVADWYAYVMSQDPDDLSILWLLSSKTGLFYLSLALVGTLVALSVEKTRKPRLLLCRPAFVIMISCFGYIAFWIIVEVVKWPESMLQIMITVQPRRVFFLPVIFSIYYIVRYVAECILVEKPATAKRSLSLLLLITWFFGGLVATTYGDHIRREYIFIAWALCLVFVLVFFHKRGSNGPNWLMVVTNERTWIVLGLTVILVKAIPFINPTSVSNIQDMFFAIEKRSYQEYLGLAAKLAGKKDSFGPPFLESLEWIKKNTVKGELFLLVGVPESASMNFGPLSGRSKFNLDPYAHRGLMHYKREGFNNRVEYLSDALGVPIDELGANAGQMRNFEATVKNLDEDHFRQLGTLKDSNKKYDYLLTGLDLDLNLPILFEKSPVILYQLRE
jgi:hypothetical protein